MRSKARTGSGSEVFLQFVLPSSFRNIKTQTYHEFNAFRFSKDEASGRVICTHYAKNVLLGAKGKVQKKDLAQLEAEVRQAFEKMGDYQP